MHMLTQTYAQTRIGPLSKTSVSKMKKNKTTCLTFILVYDNVYTILVYDYVDTGYHLSQNLTEFCNYRSKV